MKCKLCPRECGVERDKGEIGFCGVDDKIYIAKIMLHMWEEPCISGESGSGAVFFCGCTLRCVYCQNAEISGCMVKKETCRKTDFSFESKALNGNIQCKNNQANWNEEVKSYATYTVADLASKLLELQEKGANNINFVTPTHYTDKIKEAVIIARNNGLKIPIVYNCSGYEKVETLRSLEGIVDVYLTDFKYMDSELAGKYSRASDYLAIAKNAIAEMIRQTGNPLFNEKGIMTKGVIARVLCLPNHVKNSKEVCKYLYETYGDEVYISIMNQYTPMPAVSDIDDLNRKVTKREYNRLLEYCTDLGITNAFIQEGDVAKDSFIPVWDEK